MNGISSRTLWIAPSLVLVTHHIEEIMPAFANTLVVERGRVRVRDGSNRTPEDVLRELWAEVFEPTPELPEPGKATAPEGAAT